ncbi:MAG: hypothetical protein K2X82_27145 [Gemmataceae bacterium]|nr:hypothetical protein [Gemmataceae bacterium]
MPRTDSPSPAAPWLAWVAYAGLVLGGLCFGVWAGTQKPERAVEVAAAPAAPAKPEPKSEPKAEPPPKPDATDPPAKAEPKKPEAKKSAPEPKPPAKPPEPKKPEPKKPEPKPTAPAVTFAKDVLPVFRTNCLSCHGGMGEPKGGLDLRTLAATLKGGDSGPGVKPGEPDASPVWVSIADGSMPKGGKKMAEKDKEVVRAWIEAGAK